METAANRRHRNSAGLRETKAMRETRVSRITPWGSWLSRWTSNVPITRASTAAARDTLAATNVRLAELLSDMTPMTAVTRYATEKTATRIRNDEPFVHSACAGGSGTRVA